MNLKIGLDLGSAFIKVAFVDNGELIWRGLAATAPGQERLTSRLIEEGRKTLGLPDSLDAGIVSTGYGRNLFQAADLKVDEISAGALGAFRRSGGAARDILNIGGQDLKAIRLLESGQVADFRMNDKCAAGTGRFFELAARILDTPLEDFGRLSRQVDAEVSLNSTCVVFAESEMISLLARGVTRESIIKALNASVARRAAGLLGNAVMDGCLWLDGGPAQNSGLIAAFEDELMTEVKALPEPLYTVAYGAAVSLN
jgi:(R)-2-hydroxyacyl-CoA dehydratese activating ATPase